MNASIRNLLARLYPFLLWGTLCGLAAHSLFQQEQAEPLEPGPRMAAVSATVPGAARLLIP